MNRKRYRACLIGVILLAMAFGTILYIRQKQSATQPDDCILVWEESGRTAA